MLLLWYQVPMAAPSITTNNNGVHLEDEINKSVNSLKGKKTIILITHNLNLTKYCDHIYKLENSRVTQIK